MEECIVKTLAYYDVFDYPLTFSQIRKNLCCTVDISDEEFLEILDAIPIVYEFEGYYYLLGRNKLPSLRHERTEISTQKYVKAKIISKVLSKIPTIEYIGVSGSLSMNNASISDDIDLFFITKRNSLWITRFLVNIVLMLLKQKRMRSQKRAKDKICPNMFVSIDNISMAKYGQSLYKAHEIVQLKTLYDSGGIHSYFLSKNRWITKQLPNFEIPKAKKKRFKSNLFLHPIEKALFFLQKIYMGKKTKGELVEKSCAMFFPSNRKRFIGQIYSARKKIYLNLLQENIWIDNDEARFYLDEKKIRILN